MVSLIVYTRISGYWNLMLSQPASMLLRFGPLPTCNRVKRWRIVFKSGSYAFYAPF